MAVPPAAPKDGSPTLKRFEAFYGYCLIHGWRPLQSGAKVSRVAFTPDINELSSLVVPPGIVVNVLKGDVDEQRAHRWLEWTPETELDWVFVGVPYDGASTVRAGSREGPDAVRRALRNHTTYLSSSGLTLNTLRVADIGDVDVVVTHMHKTFSAIRKLADAVRRSSAGLIAVGGDHSITWPLVQGLTQSFRGKLGVIHLDQHHDLRDSHFGSDSSGVPFRKILELPGAPVLGANLVQIGIADFGNSPVHAAYAREQGVTVFTNTEVFERGMDAVVDDALRIAGDGTEALYVSIDVDVFDQSQAPGTASPNPNGLTAREAYRALRRVGRSAPVIGLDIVEISPTLESTSVTGGVGAMLVLSFLGGVAERQHAMGAEAEIADELRAADHASFAPHQPAAVRLPGGDDNSDHRRISPPEAL
jgi:formimidoylglutamase